MFRFAQHDTDKAQSTTLIRALGPLDATMIVMGSMIGSGIFITSAESARLIGAPGWLLLAWAVAGLMTITGALCCSELATMMPRAGGVYVFLARSLRTGGRFSFWLDFVSRHPDGNDRSGGDCVCKIPRRFHFSSRAGELFGPADLVRQSLRDQFIHRTNRCHRADRIAHLDEHARARDRQDCPKHIHVCKDGGIGGRRGDWIIAGLECEQRRAFRIVVEFLGQRLEPADRSAWFRLPADWRWRCCLARQWSARSLPKPHGPM